MLSRVQWKLSPIFAHVKVSPSCYFNVETFSWTEGWSRDIIAHVKSYHLTKLLCNGYHDD